MMIVSCLIYASLSTNYKAYIRLVAPLSIVLRYTFINSSGKGFEYWGNVGLVAFPVVRGFAAMNIGVIIGVIIASGFVGIPNIGYDITAPLSGIMIWIGLTTDYIIDMILVLSIAGLLFVLASKKSIVFRFLNKSIWSSFGKYSYVIYLCHAVVLSGLVWLDIHFFKFAENQVALRTSIMIATVISYSILFYIVVQKLRNYLNVIL